MKLSKIEIRASKRCPECGWRVCDKVTPTEGIIEMKCPRCGKQVRINLSCRVTYGSAQLRCRIAICA